MSTVPGERELLIAVSPLAHTRPSFEAAARAAGFRGEVAREVYGRFWREGGAGGEVARLAEPGAAVVPSPVRVHTSDSPHGPVRKFLLPVAGIDPARRAGRGEKEDPARRAGPPEKEDPARRAGPPEGLETESVVIPMRRGEEVSHTLCVSSQVGCAMGCEFCETAQMGLIRHLSAAEIAQQWWAARHHLGAACRNIVFMGMGEPLDNLDAVLGAIEVLTDQHGAGVAMRRISISTVGRIDGLTKLADRIRQSGWRRLNLAVSINAPNDAIRSRIMPINRAMPLGELIPILERWPIRGGGAICCEYVLIPGVNDAMEHADELAGLLKGVRCCVNVIPYNPRRGSPWVAPEEATVGAFLARLEAAGQFCKRRVTKGRDSMAACGQLGNEQIRKRKFVGVTALGLGVEPA